MKVSIIMPVYNEKHTVSQVLQKVQSLPLEKELIVVNDGSTDGTEEILQNLSLKNNMRLIHHQTNKGKGMAIRTGIKHATGDIIIVQDADLELNPKDILRVVEPIKKSEKKVVYGSRFKHSMDNIGTLSKLANIAVTWTSNILYNQRLTDEATGYKAFHRQVLEDIELKCTGFEFCPEVTAKAAKQGHKIYEVPVSFKPRTRQEGKKIGWKDGFQALWTLFKYRFVD